MIERISPWSNYLVKGYHCLPWLIIILLLVFTIGMCPKKSDAKLDFLDYLGGLSGIVWIMGSASLCHFLMVLSWDWVKTPIESDTATIIYGTFGAKPPPVGPSELLTWPAVSFGVHMMVGVWILCFIYYTICFLLHNIKHYE